MRRLRFIVLGLPVLFAACTGVDNEGTIAQLRHQNIEIQEEKLEGGLEKAMASYQRFLKETPDSALSAEAIRRLADLKIEKEYGILTSGEERHGRAAAAPLPAPERAARPESAPAGGAPEEAVAHFGEDDESDTHFVKRATRSQPLVGPAAAAEVADSGDDLERAGPLEAIKLYEKLLADYPLYPRNDQVLYQMSRAYEELGRIEEAMKVMDRLVREFPQSRYIDEVQFRRAEYFFTRRQYLDAEEAYADIVEIGVGSSFFELALYKLGWTFYKQELYEDALHKFMGVVDYKVSGGYDFAQTEDETERKRLEDTFRVISLSFSFQGGADAVVDYFSRYGKRSYEDEVYGNLGEYYVDKRRYNDATATYHAFVSRNPFHEKSPHFHMRVIEINQIGGFPSLVIDSKKEFATQYGLKAAYWQYYEPSAYPEVLGYLKTNLTDLANHYHALYQDPAHSKEQQAHFKEALHWYREFLISFPAAQESPTVHYQLADLLLENRAYEQAAVAYEKTAYAYPPHEKSAQAGYAAVYAHREHLGVVPPARKDLVRREVVRSSLKFADTFPAHDKAAIVMGAAVDDLYGMKEYEEALTNAQKLIEMFPDPDGDVLRAAWLVIAHSSYELLHYSEAETAYMKVLSLLPPDDKTRGALVDNLAASIYKQGEQAKSLAEYRKAAEHFLRVGRMAPASKIAPTAEYDAAAALIQVQDWAMAATVLVGFRNTFPGHELQAEVTKKIAFVYREDGQLSMAADEFERIERESQEEEVRREALLVAAELHEQTGNSGRALEVYRRYVGYFPQPVESNLETRSKIAAILKAENDREGYLSQLREIVAVDAAAGGARTERTRYLAAKAAVVLAELSYARFVEVKLVKPFEVNLRKKQALMKAATQEFGKLLDYGVGEATAAATFYLAEIYAHFSKSLMGSERPEGLNPMELEQYELALEEQAYPFEEQAIDIHQKNLQLISRGIYNEWVDRSLQKLAKFLPARYEKPEETTGIVTSLDSFIFALERPTPSALPAAEEQTPVAAAVPMASGTMPEQVQIDIAAQSAEVEQLEESAPAAKTKAVAPPEPAEGVVVGESIPAAEAEEVDEPAQPAKPEAPPELEPGAEPMPEQVQMDIAAQSAEVEQLEESGPAAEMKAVAQPEPAEGVLVGESIPAAEAEEVDEPAQPAKPKATPELEPGVEPMRNEKPAPPPEAEHVAEFEPGAGPVAEPEQEKPLPESVEVLGLGHGGAGTTPDTAK